MVKVRVNTTLPLAPPIKGGVLNGPARVASGELLQRFR
jgi:hypothetical protein